MDFQNYWYLLILLVLAGITMFLFAKKSVVFITEIKYMLPAIIFTSAIFSMLNIRFVDSGIISFNNNYVLGKTIYNLPIEEWLFLLILSFFAFSVYILVSERFANLENPNLLLAISVVLLLVFGFMAWSLRQKLVPFFVFFLLAIYFGYTLFRKSFVHHFVKFYLTYIIVVLPFLVVKAILNTLPVILYNSEHIIGIRLFNVPVEEFGSLFLLMLINLTIFEYLRDNHLY